MVMAPSKPSLAAADDDDVIIVLDTADNSDSDVELVEPKQSKAVAQGRETQQEAVGAVTAGVDSGQDLSDDEELRIVATVGQVGVKDSIPSGICHRQPGVAPSHFCMQSGALPLHHLVPPRPVRRTGPQSHK